MKRLFTLLALGVAVALLAAAVYSWLRSGAESVPSWRQGSTVRASSAGTSRIQYGYENGEVRFVAFVRGGKDTPPEIISVDVSTPMAKKFHLVLPGEPVKDLPTEFNVFEWIDGRFDQRTLPLTMKQAKAFCETERPDYSIKALRKFLEGQ